MRETLLTAAVTLFVGLLSAWVALGSRDRLMRATLKDELEVLAWLDEGSDLAVRLRRITHRRLRKYLAREEGRRRRRRYAIVFATLTLNAVLSAAIVGGKPEFDSLGDAALRGLAIGLALGAATFGMVQVMDDSRFSRWLRRVLSSKSARGPAITPTPRLAKRRRLAREVGTPPARPEEPETSAPTAPADPAPPVPSTRADARTAPPT